MLFASQTRYRYNGCKLGRLVSNLNAIQNPHPHLVVVWSTHNYIEAHIVAGRLNANNIPAIIDREAAASAIGLSIGPMGELRVLVHPENYDLAVAILTDEDPDMMLHDGEVEDVDPDE